MDIFSILNNDGESEDRRDDGVAIDTRALGAGDVPAVETEANAELLDALRQVHDPEVGVNIVDLGLVYAIERIDGITDVVMTMTTPVCPLSEVIERRVRRRLLELDGIDRVRIAIVFEPRWSPEMMSDEAKRRLGG